ncbi:ribosomal protein L3 [Acidimicrobium ferrooxidans DSM 10331]|uniref:Large ribosomal subunit protein uL3 n=1 Tax=Acidimicrobium ferrooxidans (strain DSM 10331 / JCM 15462 / NBRC 103882 / ICP) TaxID=525909 RepID=C7M2X2_ACIFD|nr:50S ribosomal protein L3 [Acidimicrobium ferrooxidans]ACU53366.1 ribosomal protein L3 [Acidimicrobium ferrooxidans DSM 10331]
MARKTFVGEKVGMTQVWTEGDRAVPVTVIKVVPTWVVRTKTPERDGYEAVQVAVGRVKPQRLSRPVAGQFEARGVEAGARIMELRLDGASSFEPGDQIGIEGIEPGMRLDVVGVSKGHGFSGGMKRHNFRGQGAAHGNHKKHRAPGSIGACATPARVFKGTRMAGQYGTERVTIHNLEVVRAEPERQLVLVKGSIPGPRGAIVVVRDSVKGRK